MILLSFSARILPLRWDSLEGSEGNDFPNHQAIKINDWHSLWAPGKPKMKERKLEHRRSTLSVLLPSWFIFEQWSIKSFVPWREEGCEPAEVHSELLKLMRLGFHVRKRIPKALRARAWGKRLLSLSSDRTKCYNSICISGSLFEHTRSFAFISIACARKSLHLVQL